MDSPTSAAEALHLCGDVPADSDFGVAGHCQPLPPIFSRISTFRLSAVVYGYTGLSAEDMSDRIIVGFERGLTTTVNDIEHIESQSLNGLGVIKIFFHPNVRIDMAMAQITAHRTIRHPPGSAGNTSAVHHVLQRVLRPDYSIGAFRKGSFRAATLRPGGELHAHAIGDGAGSGLPNPYGGKQRQIKVDLDITALQAKGLSPNDVVNAIGNQNLILPGGTVKIGSLGKRCRPQRQPQDRRGTE